jgi:hypothetical protein
MGEEIRVAMVAGASVVPLPRPRAERARPVVAEEQLAYARLLDLGMKVGLLLLTVTFVLYVTGALAPRVPVADLPKYWSLPVKQYLAATGIPTGWGWVRLLANGDCLNFVGIAFLSGVTIACYLAITPILLRKKDVIYVGIALLEVLVLALAASGVLTAGAH